MSSETKTIAETMVWMAEERLKKERFQNLASAIYSVSMDVGKYLSEAMKEANEDERCAKK